MDTDKLNRWLTLTANVGVLIGLILLLFEIGQNTDLMRAQIAMDRSISQTETLSDWANGGEIVPIEVKLYEQVDGFPQAIGWTDLLTAEEIRRYLYRMLARVNQLQNDWFLCAEGLIAEEICEREVYVRMRRNLHRYYELDIGFGRAHSGFIALMQDYAKELGLPPINDDGTWQK